MLILWVAAVLSNQSEPVQELLESFQLILVQVLDLLKPLLGDCLCVCVSFAIINVEIFKR